MNGLRGPFSKLLLCLAVVTLGCAPSKITGSGDDSSLEQESHTKRLAFYNSSNCSSYLIGYVNDKTECSELNSSNYAYSVKVGDKCYSTVGMTLQAGCEAFKAAASEEPTKMVFNSSNCRGYAVGAFSQKSTCEDLENTVSSYVYSIELDGTCSSVAGMSFDSACRSFQHASREYSVLAYNSSNCSGYLVGATGEKTECSDLDSNYYVYSISKRGECMSTAGMSIQNACSAFQAWSNDDAALIMFNSSNCRGYAVGSVGGKAECSNIADSGHYVYSIQSNGVCRSTAGQSFVNACNAFSALGRDSTATVIYNSSNCRGYAVGAFDEKTSCSTSLKNSGHYVYSIDLPNGGCTSTAGMPADTACMAFAPVKDPHATFLYNSSNCRGYAVGAVNEKSECEEVGANVSSYVYSIYSEGSCQSVSGMSYQDACYVVHP